MNMESVEIIPENVDGIGKKIRQFSSFLSIGLLRLPCLFLESFRTIPEIIPYDSKNGY